MGVDWACKPYPGSPISESAVQPRLDYADVVGQEVAKRAIAVAAAGGLGMLMIGPPGSGKSMLAKRMTTILPPIDPVERQEALCIHSVAGDGYEGLLAGERPFRRPHHSITPAGLVGGGRPVRPGEASLAHGGVLQRQRNHGILRVKSLGRHREPTQGQQSAQSAQHPLAENCLLYTSPSPRDS